MQCTVDEDVTDRPAASAGDRFVLGLIAGAIGGAIAAPIGFGLISRQAAWEVGFVAPFGAVFGACRGSVFGFALPDTISQRPLLVRGALLGMPCVALTPMWTPFVLIRAIETAVDLAKVVAPGPYGRLPGGLVLFALLWLGPGALAGLIGAWALGRLERWWVGVRERGGGGGGGR